MSRTAKKTIKYTDGPLNEVRVVPDFLPPPSELTFREETVKVTLTLSKSSVDFFKQEAQKQNVPYQKMIRRLLDLYTQQHMGT